MLIFDNTLSKKKRVKGFTFFSDGKLSLLPAGTPGSFLIGNNASKRNKHSKDPSLLDDPSDLFTTDNISPTLIDENFPHKSSHLKKKSKVSKSSRKKKPWWK